MFKHPRRPLRVVVPRPDRVRTLDHVAFGWLDARLQHDGWLRVMTPQAVAVYALLCLAADRSGVSFYRRSRMAHELGFDDAELFCTLTRLCDLDLVAYRPFRAGAADGFHQVLSVPDGGPPPLIPDHALSVDRLVAKARI
jgi:hypothetical protein